MIRCAPVVALLVLVLVLVLAPPALAAEPSSCVECHTDEGTLRALFVPPKMAGGEGEG